MDKDRNNGQLSRTAIDSSIQDDVSEIDFDVTPTPSVASIVTNEGYVSSSASKTASDIEHHYELTGNINVINQL